MGFTEALTIVFIILKLLGVIQWGWFFVILPEIIALVIYIILVFAASANSISKLAKRKRNK